MVMIVFGIAGEEFSAVEFLEKNRISPFRTWARGDVRSLHRVHGDSGFAIELPDVEKSIDVPGVMSQFLVESETWLARLPAEAQTRYFDLGVMVGSERSFAPSVSFSHELLGELSARRINLTVSSYPVSDEE